MNDADSARCRDFAHLLFGSDIGPEIINTALGFCDSFDDFRIRLVAELAPHNDVARGIMVRWVSAIRPSGVPLDGNALLHMLEAISARLVALQEKLQTASEENVERLSVIDSHATTLISLQETAAAMRTSLAAIRVRLEALDDASDAAEGEQK